MSDDLVAVGSDVELDDDELTCATWTAAKLLGRDTNKVVAELLNITTGAVAQRIRRYRQAGLLPRAETRGKRPMSIRKLPTPSCKPRDGFNWCVKDRHADGRTAHRHFARKDEAENFVIRLRAERVGGEPVERRVRTTFEQYAETWRVAQTWKEPATARYGLNRVYPIIGAKPLSSIDGLALQTLRRKLFEHPYSRSTVVLTMHFVKAVLRQAHADRLISTDPTARVRLPRRDSLDKAGKVTADDVPTRDEALAIIAGAPLPYRAAVALGLGCGMRVGEGSGSPRHGLISPPG